jgi:hypothetical protein
VKFLVRQLRQGYELQEEVYNLRERRHNCWKVVQLRGHNLPVGVYKDILEDSPINIQAEDNWQDM